MSRLIESILIPTDGSEGALAGAKYGIALASRTGADVHVLTIVDARHVPADAETVLAELEADAEEAVEAVASMVEAADADTEVVTAVERGTPFQSIREYAHRREIDVIAMGTKGRTGIDRILLGSVTENVLRTARTPVLAVPPNAPVSDAAGVTFERLLLPTDGSEGAAIATDWGIALATHLDAMVHVMSAVDTSPFPGGREPDALREELERRGEAAIETVRERAEEAAVGVSDSVETGDPVTAITAAASDYGADLIVMGTHGQTGVGQWFLGSVTENVVGQADVPVFCVPVAAESP
ncbi:universal stress protein UspA-like protein [Halovivax ruber XH-70]|uniref:Universal stress protein UspA-like protein n=1 Tax=Halovivax ruber (strain DSM 18193 / JCM 13892 / XH-70) TaxID=797302 RepID=L0IFB5_HALRX|nr:universal stress protein [Halovivax ruber]AGB17533.1 universal stress protein UspA-like protein [Halovivax ruber XH-70]